MLSHTVIAAADINGQKKIFGRFRGKVAREIYRCGKGVLVTRSIAKPFFYAVSKIPNELSKGFVYSVAGQIGETTLGYISGIGFIRYIYKVSSPEKLKATARIIYNVGALPMTIYSKASRGRPVENLIRHRNPFFSSRITSPFPARRLCGRGC